MAVFDHQRFRRLRRESGLSQEQFALALGVSGSSVVKFEQGTIRPSVNTLGRMADVLKCNVGDLFSDPLIIDDRPTELGQDVDEWISATLAGAPNMTPDIARRVSAALFAAVNR